MCSKGQKLISKKRIKLISNNFYKKEGLFKADVENRKEINFKLKDTRKNIITASLSIRKEKGGDLFSIVT